MTTFRLNKDTAEGMKCNFTTRCPSQKSEKKLRAQPADQPKAPICKTEIKVKKKIEIEFDS